MASEGAIRPQRAEFVRETTTGVFPTDPAFLAFSDNITSLSWSPDPGVDPRRGIGDPDPVVFHKGPEDHELSIEYDLQNWLVTGGGDPLDASADGLLRTANNQLGATHSVLLREENNGVEASETVDGWGDTGQESGSPTSKDTRMFLVGKGGRHASVTYTGDPGSDIPVVTEIQYNFEKVREYQIDQPPSSTTLDVYNGGSSDVDVTIEDEGAGTTETITATAGTTTSGSSSFTGIDAVSLASRVDGDVAIIDTNLSEVLAIIRGGDHYAAEGDLGVPALGGGSHAGAIGTAYETLLDDSIERPAGTGIAFEINSVEFSVDNNLDIRTQVGTSDSGISVGERTIEVSATVLGPTQSIQQMDEAMAAIQADIDWVMSGGTLTADQAANMDPGGVDKSTGEAAMSLDNTFQATGVTIT